MPGWYWLPSASVGSGGSAKPTSRQRRTNNPASGRVWWRKRHRRFIVREPYTWLAGAVATSGWFDGKTANSIWQQPWMWYGPSKPEDLAPWQLRSSSRLAG